MELSLPALLPIRRVRGGIEEDGEREREVCVCVCVRERHTQKNWERGGRGSRILLISLLCSIQILQCSIFASVCSLLQKKFVYIISSLTLPEAK